MINYKKNTLLSNIHIRVIALAFLGTLLFITSIATINSSYSGLSDVDPTLAKGRRFPTCGENVYDASLPAPYVYEKGCLRNNTKLYLNSSYTIEHLPSVLTNQAFIRVPNINMRDDANLVWHVTFHKSADVYLLFRQSSSSLPDWIKADYDVYQTKKYAPVGWGWFKRFFRKAYFENEYAYRRGPKNDLKAYTVMKKKAPVEVSNSVDQTIEFRNAGTDSAKLLSMYVVVIVPKGASALSTDTPSPVPSPTVTPTPSPTPSPSPSPTLAPTPSPTEEPTAEPTSSATDTPAPTADALLDEVALHDTVEDCWVLYESPTTGRHLYNITNYFGLHTGGDDALGSACGTDMTERYNNGDAEFPDSSGNPHVHTAESNRILQRFLVR